MPEQDPWAEAAKTYQPPPGVVQSASPKAPSVPAAASDPWAEAAKTYKPQAPEAEQPGFASRLYQGTVKPLVDTYQNYARHTAENQPKYGPLAGFPALGQTLADVNGGIGRGMVDGFRKTITPLKSGDVGHALQQAPGMVPFIGPTAVQAGEDMEHENYPAMAGDVAALGANVLAPKIGKGLAEGGLPAVKGAVEGGVKSFAPIKYGMHNLMIPAPVAGAMAGHFAGEMAGPMGAKLGAATGFATPIVRGVINGARDAVADKPLNTDIPANYKPYLSEPGPISGSPSSGASNVSDVATPPARQYVNFKNRPSSGPTSLGGGPGIDPNSGGLAYPKPAPVASPQPTPTVLSGKPSTPGLSNVGDLNAPQAKPQNFQNPEAKGAPQLLPFMKPGVSPLIQRSAPIPAVEPEPAISPASPRISTPSPTLTNGANGKPAFANRPDLQGPAEELQRMMQEHPDAQRPDTPMTAPTRTPLIRNYAHQESFQDNGLPLSREEMNNRTQIANSTAMELHKQGFTPADAEAETPQFKKAVQQLSVSYSKQAAGKYKGASPEKTYPMIRSIMMGDHPGK